MGPHLSEIVQNDHIPPRGSIFSFRPNRWMMVIVAVGLALVWSACTTGQNQSKDEWMRGYLDDPDRVWAACLQVLDDLDYEVEELDRIEGTIRAVATGDVPYKGVVLRIDQIKRTDIVRVHVFAGESGGGQYPDVDKYAGAAGTFLEALDVMLGVK